MRHWINGKDPRQYGFDFGLWTRQIVAALIAQRFGVKLGVTAVGRLLAQLDITPQKPLLRNESLRQRVLADLTDIQSRPRLVQSFFKAPTVAYTAD